MNSAQTFANIFGVTAAILWLLSSAAWFWSLRIKLDLGRPPVKGENVGILISTNDDGTGNFQINGMDVPTYNKIAAYQRATYFWNATASILSGIAAISAGSAAYLTFAI